MTSTDAEICSLIASASLDPKGAAAGLRKLFDEARQNGDDDRAAALGHTLQPFMAPREWYDIVWPLLSSRPNTCMKWMSAGTAQEELGFFADALNSFARAVLAEGLDGDRELLEACVFAMRRVLDRTKAPG